MSRYIKGMLSSVRIPLVHPVSPGDTILQGCQYLYDKYIILCESSGRLFVDGISESEIYPSNTIYPLATMYPGTGESTASFTILSRYYEEANLSNYSFLSDCNYYDSDTHYHLGQYLRYLKHSKGIDLLPYYNCFNYKVINDVYLTPTSPYYAIMDNADYKVAAVPIEFGKDYTIAIDCSSEIRIRCVFYGESGLILNPSGDSDTPYISDTAQFVTSYRSYPNSSFKKPFTYRIDTNVSSYHSMSRNLYMLIQLPKSNNSSIVVLEGDYTNSSYDVISTDYYDEDTGEAGQLMPVYNPNLSLLFANCGKTFAFSDRLIEYLVGSVITPLDEIPNNIIKVQSSMLQLSGDYYTLAKDSGIDAGLWDDALTRAMKLLLSSNCLKFEVDDEGNIIKYSSYKNELPFMFDNDGNINKDIERYFLDRLGDG